MNWPWTQTRRTLEAALEELQETRQLLEIERARRINAEAIASERGEELGRMSEQALRFEERYAEVTNKRLESLDAVNATVMRQDVTAQQQPQQHIELKPRKRPAPFRDFQSKLIDAAIQENKKVTVQ